jgi:hypothetical protein
MTTLNSIPNGLLSTVDATGTLNIQTNSVNALAIDTNQNATMNYVSAQNTFGFKNRIINGAMVIDQRNAGASGTTANVYTVDRWFYNATQVSKGTWQQNAGSVTPPAGFKNYLGFTSSSAYSVVAGDYFAFQQVIEGYNIADLAWGTANAKTVTLSFWVYSSLTGTFGGAFQNSGLGQSYPFTYSIPVANTWTQISITIVGSTSSTWLSTNGAGLYVVLSLGAGSTWSGTAGAWTSTPAFTATGATSVVGTNGATFYITGVQLEAGKIATPFDYRDYGRELIMCQRYCYKALPGVTNGVYGFGFCNDTASGTVGIPYPVTMRTSPSFTASVGPFFAQTNTINATPTTLSLQVAGLGVASVAFSGASGLSAGVGVKLLDNNSANTYLLFTSEL